jgi:amino acid adenylation domain-containing protein/thioester reductase-like protein
MGCRFPGGVEDVSSFWKMLTDGRSGVREVPPDRWDVKRFYHPDSAIPGMMTTKWGGFVDSLDKFDAHFWGISPREVLRMDPQQRWLLEVAWEAIEDSGTPPQRLRGTSVGVFVGIAGNDYAGLQMPYHEQIDAYTNSGCTLSIASNRISYLLDLTGPSFSVDTACSSALVAVWSACRSMWSGVCEGALAGGVNSIITPHATLGFSKASMLSPNGRCFAFDARANGYVRGEGAGMVYIKPLARAVADGNRIYAVIRAAVSNQDGHTSSMTVPGVEGQTAMLRQAYQQAGLSPSRVTYMEAHGTGTPVGDPIEATALGHVLSEGRSPQQPCLMGSVKTNIGHLEAGSGIAGLIKAALVLHHDKVPPSLNFETPNPYIPFDSLGLRVVTRLQRLPHHDGLPPVVAVNSFGFGGTNAHVVLEQAPAPAAHPSAPPQVNGKRPNEKVERSYVLPISAREDKALRRYVESYRDLLADPAAHLPDVGYAAGARKEHHDHRLVVIGKDASQMRKRLGAWLHAPGQTEGVISGRCPGNVPPLVFVFTGQGAQWWAMGRQLLECEPVFRRTVKAVDKLLRPLAGWSLMEEMKHSEAESNIDRTDIAQPAIFALQVALAELWKSWGIEPGRVIGHSVGEVAAAYCAGIYTLEDAVKIIYHRSRLQNSTGGRGRMLAVGISAAEARLAIGNEIDRVQIAVFNSPNLVTLSGDTEPLEQIGARLEQAGKFTRWLRIQYAFHTHQMDPLKDELLRALANICPRPSRIPFISTVTGGLLSGDRLDAVYWWKNVRQPVLFAPAIANLLRGREETFLEIGPHPALASSITECMKEQGRSGTVFHSLRRETDESLEMLNNLAGLHVRGLPVDWAAVNQSTGTFVELPRYPWSYESFWLESKDSLRSRLAPLDHPFLGTPVTAAQPTWQMELHPGRFAWLNDHRFWDSIVFPGAAYAEMGIALARRLFPDEPHAVEELDIKKALFFNADQPPTIQLVFDPETKSFSIFSATGDKEQWDLHAQGRLLKIPPCTLPAVDLEQVRRRLTEHLDHEKYYSDMREAGYQFGPNFQEVQNVWLVHGEALAEIVVPADIAATIDDYQFQPAIMDACFHIFKGLKYDPDSRPEDNFYLPQAFRRIHLYAEKPPTHLWAHGRLLLDDGKSLISDILVYDKAGRPVAEIRGFRVDRVEQKRTADDIDNCYYQFHWEPRRLRGQGVEGSCKFPSAAEMTAAARVNVAERYQDRKLKEYYTHFAPRLDALVCQAVQNAFLKLGWRPRRGDVFTTQALIDQLGIVDSYHRLASANLRDLAKHGVLRARDQNVWEVVQDPRSSDVSGELEQLATDFVRFAPEVALHQRSAPHLAEVLSGETDAVELMFPNGSFELVERFYVEGGDFPVQVPLLANAVARLLATLPPRRVLRVLEVGAGTGSFTRQLLPMLPANRTEYLFTDVGPAFLTAAKKRFAEYPYVEYRTFDVEKDPQAQGIQPGSFDIIVGSLVLHATADLKQVLANLRSCLSEGGMLLFLEAFPRRHAWDLTFGLLSGWWRYTDIARRSHSPLLKRDQWLALLTECGYLDAGSFSTHIDEEEADQAFLFAFAPAIPARVEQSGESSTGMAGRYLAFADRSGVADKLVGRLRERGSSVIMVRPGKAFEQVSEDEFTITRDSEEDLRRLLALTSATTPGLAGVIHCWSLDHPHGDALTLADLQEAQQTGVLSGLRLIHAASAAMPPRIWFLTRGMHHVRNGDGVSGLASAPIVGLLRVANNEFFPARFGLIDLNAQPSPEESGDLFYEITAGDDDLEVAYREDQRQVLRLGRVRAEEMPNRFFSSLRSDGSVIPFRLQTKKPGILTNLTLNETQRCEPGPDEIEIRVRAGGINFRDVMKALGTYPGNPIDLLWFGDDVAGVVERAGANVRHLRPGDEVAGMVPYCFRTFVAADARMVFRKPPRMSFEQAATLPTVFLTAHYAINHLAHMQAGESILIHAGTGGVGQAAIQIAKHLGLEIFATAGTPEKRQMLLDQGVHHVLNSRTLEFADQILEITQGKGVDAVLNSLAGDFIPKSMSVLAPFGRFLEIGKIDIYRNSKIGLEALKNNISYFVIDLAQHLERKPALVAKMFQELGERFAASDYAPLPHTVFPITKVVDAFRYMAQGKHVGKNVLSFDEKQIAISPCTEDGHRFRANATYLITGGAGGFGLEVAKWMVHQGAHNVVLFSRGGPRGEAAIRDIEQLRSAGANILDARGDATKLEDVQRVVRQIQDELPPLKGVIHAAMVLDDEFIGVLDERRFNTALEPKMLGAWSLHTATVGIDLEHFVCFSSYSSIVGVPKQSNYNAGNFFLDSLAHYRRERGLPALTVNWGPLLGAGFVERNRKTADFLEKIGTKPFNMPESLRILGRLTLLDIMQMAVARVEWQTLSKACLNLTRANTYTAVTRETADSERGGSLLARLQSCGPDSRPDLIEDFISAQVASVFAVPEEKVDRDAALTSLGLDSLMAVELTNRIEREVGTSIPMGSLLGGPSIKVLAQTILRLVAPALNGDHDAGAAEAQGGGLLALEKVVPQVDEFPLSEGQQALWYLYLLEPESSAYNLTFSGKFRPLVNIEHMYRAFESLFERHPMLDITISDTSGQPMQRVRKGGKIDFREHDVRQLTEVEIKGLLVEHANQPFDLRTGPVVRLEFFRTRDDAHIVLLCLHHIVADAWSVIVLLNDLIESHFAFQASEKPKLLPQPISYQDFVSWETKHLTSLGGKRTGEFWKRQLKDAPLLLELPTDHPRPTIQSFRGATHTFMLDDELSQKALALAAEQNVTLFTALLSTYQVLLHRYCHQDDVLVGCPLAGRNQRELQPVVGYFINPVPLRSRVDDDPTFVDFLKRNAQTTAGAIENQQFPFPRLVQQLSVPRDPSRSPVFQVSFSMERIPGLDDKGIAVFLIGQGGHKFYFGDLSVETIDLTLRQAQFEITLVVEEAGGNIYGCWQYNRDLFEPATIARLNEMFARILREVAHNPLQHISEINLLDAPEQTRVLQTWNATAAPLPEPALVHELVRQQAVQRPRQIAVRCGADQLTYSELEARANGLAAKLQAAGVAHETPVGVFMRRSTDMVVALLGVLKAGGCYVPMDPEFPLLRLQQMLENACPPVIVSQRDLAARLPANSASTILVESASHAPNPPPLAGFTPESLAYIIYTSGSTGTPKGVEVPHRAAANFLASMSRQPGMSASDCLLAVTTLSFDIAFLELFLPLVNGGQVCIATREEARDGLRLGELLEECKVNVMQATPSTWQLLLEAGWEGKPDLRIFCGGEALRQDLATRLQECGREVWNLYGPTETTVWSACAKLSPADEMVLIGRPIANTSVYVLDDKLHLLPAGMIGELYIGGSGLARGYHGREDLTAERFPTIALPNGKSERLYKTGDLARWTPDGRLQCLGRSDCQVKVRGHRIELEEIEVIFTQHPQVERAVVHPVGHGTPECRLVAYVLAANRPPARELQAFVRERLPDYMVPGVIEFLDAIPLTPNGKVDRKALPNPERAQPLAERAFVAPRTETERQVAAVWQQVLGVERVGLEDDFFELGGHSLTAIRLISQLRNTYGIQLPLARLFESATVSSVAELIDAMRAETELESDETDTDYVAEALLDQTTVPVVRAPADLLKMDRVLLTGATGFLGAFLLDELLRQTDADVMCLVRARDADEGRERLCGNLRRYGLTPSYSLDRVIPIVGDLEKPLLGLSAAEFEQLARATDVIYHNGAVVNLLYPYSLLRAANVGGTREVLRLAAQSRPKPVHFVSTFSVQAAENDRSRPIVTELDPLPPCESLSGGYARSKWVGEQLIRQARARGLPVSVYRPGHITGHSRTGVCNPQDFLHTLMLACTKVGAVPDVDTEIDLTPVDYVSQAIVHLSQRPESIGGTYHLVNPHPLPLPSLIEWVQRSGLELATLPYQTWREQLETLVNGDADLLAPLLNVLAPAQAIMAEDQFHWHPRYDCQRAVSALAESGISCPRVGEQLILTYLGYLCRSGILALDGNGVADDPLTLRSDEFTQGQYHAGGS